jgi:uncharacterized protein (DUF1330 family)
MPKGYWIAHAEIADLEKYKKYQAANAYPFKKYGAKFLVRGGQQEIREGSSKSRTVILEFETFEAAVACYESPEYQDAKKIRSPISNADLVIVSGV